MQQGPSPNEIKLTFCDSCELRVFPCSKITKIYLALICQCSIGPPKKHPPICGLFHSFFLNRGELVRAGAYQKAGTNKNSTSIMWWIQILRPRRIPCSLVAPISYYLPAVYIAYLSPASWYICFLKKWLLLQQYFVHMQMAANWDESTQNIGAVIYIYIGI